MIAWALKAFAVIVVAAVTALLIHFGSVQDPFDQQYAAQLCLLKAQNQTGMRGQKITQFHTTRFFGSSKVLLTAVTADTGAKDEIYCHDSPNVDLLFINGREVGTNGT